MGGQGTPKNVGSAAHEVKGSIRDTGKLLIFFKTSKCRYHTDDNDSL